MGQYEDHKQNQVNPTRCWKSSREGGKGQSEVREGIAGARELNLSSGEEVRINQRACQVQGFCISSSGAGGKMGWRRAGCQPKLAVHGGCNEGRKKSVMGGEEEHRWLCFKQETTQFTP